MPLSVVRVDVQRTGKRGHAVKLVVIGPGYVRLPVCIRAVEAGYDVVVTPDRADVDHSAVATLRVPVYGTRNLFSAGDNVTVL